MFKFLTAIYKESLLLRRDIGGLVILFIMPLVLVVTITIIQNSSFESTTESTMDLVLVDNDKGEVSQKIISDLSSNKSFALISEYQGKSIDEQLAKDLVLQGEYKLAIVLPENFSSSISTNVKQNVNQILNQFTGEELVIETDSVQPQDVSLYFDPVLQVSIKNAIKNDIDKLVSQIESTFIYNTFKNELGVEGNLLANQSIVKYTEINPLADLGKSLPNSVQHNVPAWSLFAIFFIAIPLSINIVAEKNQGTFVRLKTSPVSFFVTIGSKVVVYLVVSILQFTSVLLLAKYLFPYLGLPDFEVNGDYFLLFIMAIFSGLAAIGLGIFLGVISKTPEQSAPFGATSVVLLAAIGGIWIPVFIMPEILQALSNISPMNWALNGFYDVIIRSGSFLDILPEILSLMLFFTLMMVLSFYFDEMRKKYE